MSDLPTTTISNCSISTSIPATNKHNVMAIEAIARSIEANAMAASALANALKGPQINSVGIKISNNNDEGY